MGKAMSIEELSVNVEIDLGMLLDKELEADDNVVYLLKCIAGKMTGGSIESIAKSLCDSEGKEVRDFIHKLNTIISYHVVKGDL